MQCFTARTHDLCDLFPLYDLDLSRQNNSRSFMMHVAPVAGWEP